MQGIAGDPMQIRERLRQNLMNQKMRFVHALAPPLRLRAQFGTKRHKFDKSITHGDFALPPSPPLRLAKHAG